MEIKFEYIIPRQPFRSGTLEITFKGYVNEHGHGKDWLPSQIVAHINSYPFEFGISAAKSRLIGDYALTPNGWLKRQLHITYDALPTCAEWSRPVGGSDHDEVIEQIVLDAIKANWNEEVMKTITLGAQKETLKELQQELQEVEERQMNLQDMIDSLSDIVFPDDSEEIHDEYDESDPDDD